MEGYWYISIPCFLFPKRRKIVVQNMYYFTSVDGVFQKMSSIRYKQIKQVVHSQQYHLSVHCEIQKSVVACFINVAKIFVILAPRYEYYIYETPSTITDYIYSIFVFEVRVFVCLGSIVQQNYNKLVAIVSIYNSTQGFTLRTYLNIFMMLYFDNNY